MPRASNRKAKKEPEESFQFTPAQVRRLEQELERFPSPSPYYKKKIATSLAKELKISDKPITNWLNVKCAKESKTYVTIKPSAVVKKEVQTPVETTSKTTEVTDLAS